MWRPSRSVAWVLVWQAASGVAASGCDTLQDLETLPKAVLIAGGGSASKTLMRNVIPSRPAPAVHDVVIEEERYLGDVARQLGVTVDAILRDNRMIDNALSPGMVLKVRTTRDLVDAFESRREARKQARVEAEAARIKAKLKAQAEARAARRAARVAARRNRGRPAARVIAKAGGASAARTPAKATAPKTGGR